MVNLLIIGEEMSWLKGAALVWTALGYLTWVIGKWNNQHYIEKSD
ncbi:hypothetical protein [Echinicola arenosa]|nr:hypothetical protein [Echinicola arenosa]